MFQCHHSKLLMALQIPVRTELFKNKTKINKYLLFYVQEESRLSVEQRLGSFSIQQFKVVVNKSTNAENFLFTNTVDGRGHRKSCPSQ